MFSLGNGNVSTGWRLVTIGLLGGPRIGDRGSRCRHFGHDPDSVDVIGHVFLLGER